VRLANAARAAALGAVLACAQGAAFDAAAQSRYPGVVQEPVREREPVEHNFPERTYPERDTVPFQAPSRERGARPPKVEKLSVNPPTQPSRDLALARCDSFRGELESVIRQEMRGGSAAAMEKLRAKRQAIHQARLDAGC
jgi:hypothetical protein